VFCGLLGREYIVQELDKWDAEERVEKAQ